MLLLVPSVNRIPEEIPHCVEWTSAVSGILAANVFVNLHAEFGDVFRTHHFAQDTEILHQAATVHLPRIGHVSLAQFVELLTDEVQHFSCCLCRVNRRVYWVVRILNGAFPSASSLANACFFCASSSIVANSSSVGRCVRLAVWVASVLALSSGALWGGIVHE